VQYPFVPVNPPYLPANNNPTGCYRTYFTVPTSWGTTRPVHIQFESVKSAYYVYCNGVEIGYSQDSFVHAEFDLTAHVYRDGRPNLLAVKVLRWCDGSYLEDQDFWDMSGIQREVLVFSPAPVYLRDVRVNASLTDDYEQGLFSLEVDVRNHPSSTSNSGATESILVQVYNEPANRFEALPTTTLAAYTAAFPVLAPGSESTISVATNRVVSDIQPWSAESPKLYRVLVSVLLGDGTVRETRTVVVGFRKVELRNAALLVNGVAITLRGVNRHEHHPELGRNVPLETCMRDIELFHQNNINAVRTCHYPNHPRW